MSNSYINVECSECGSPIRRRPINPKTKLPIKNFFCNYSCKAEFQRRAKLLSRDELYEMYVTDGMSAVDIGEKIGRHSKSVWYWLKDYGIPTRPRGSDKRQHFKKGHTLCVGRTHTDEAKEKIRQARIDDGSRCLFLPNGDHVLKGRRGKDHPSWKGGGTPARQAFYGSEDWKKSCVEVWSRADAFCEICGLDHRKIDRNKIKFHVHHVYSFTSYPEHRSDVDNLMLLCQGCHKWVHSRNNVDRLYIKEKENETS